MLATDCRESWDGIKAAMESDIALHTLEFHNSYHVMHCNLCWRYMYAYLSKMNKQEQGHYFVDLSGGSSWARITVRKDKKQK